MAYGFTRRNKSSASQNNTFYSASPPILSILHYWSDQITVSGVLNGAFCFFCGYNLIYCSKGLISSHILITYTRFTPVLDWCHWTLNRWHPTPKWERGDKTMISCCIAMMRTASVNSQSVQDLRKRCWVQSPWPPWQNPPQSTWVVACPCSTNPWHHWYQQPCWNLHWLLFLQ